MFGDAAQMALQSAAAAFVIGIQMSAPFIVLGLVFYLGMGILARMMPQLQVFFVAMPATIWVGLMLLALLLSMMMGWYLTHFENELAAVPGSRRVSDEAPEQSSKTEDPSQKKLDDAHKRGDVVKSQEVNNWFMIAGSGLLFSLMAAPTTAGLAQQPQACCSPMPTSSRSAGRRSAVSSATSTATILLRRDGAAGGAGGVRGSPPIWCSTGRCCRSIRSRRSSPRSRRSQGVKRLFSRDALVNFVKGLVKLGVVGGVIVCGDLARARPARDHGDGRSGAAAAGFPGAGAQGVRRGARGRDHHRARRLRLPAQPLVEPAQDDGAGDARRVQADGGRPRRSRAASAQLRNERSRAAA